MRKVLYLRSTFNPGGTESLLLNLFNFKQQKIKFIYVLIKDGSLISSLSNTDNIHYSIIRKKKFDISLIFQLLKVIKKEGISYIHTHQTIELLYASLIKIFRPRIKIFHTIHGYHSKDYRWAALIEIYLLKLCYKVLTVSNATKCLLIKQNYPKGKIDVLYNAVGIPTKLTKEKKIEFLKLVDFKREDILIGMIGNFVWWKDQITVIKAYKLIKEKFPNLKLVFIGQDNTKFGEDSKKEASIFLNNGIYFLGAMVNAAMYLELFNLYIFSTLADTFGIVLIEAMLSKIPILASDIEVCVELSQCGKYFDLFKTNDYINLSDKLLYFLDSIPNIERLEMSFQYSLDRFSIDKYFESLIKIYE